MVDLGRWVASGGRGRRQSLGLAAALALGLASGAGCGEGDGKGWQVRRFGKGDAAYDAVRQDLIGPCRVTEVLDGDTLDVECRSFSDQVRLLRIDAPEGGQAGHAGAQQALRRLVEDRDVYLLLEEKGVRARGYGRLLAYAYADEHNVNIEMVRQGWSTFWVDFGEGRFPEAFRAAEEEARSERRGDLAMSIATLQRAKALLNVVWVVLAVSFALPAGPLVGALRLAFVLMLAAHALEFLFFQRTLARLGGSLGHHFVQVLLYGLLHLQLAKAQAGGDAARR